MKFSKGKLYLIPNTLGEEKSLRFLSPMVAEAIGEVEIFLAESPRSARRLIRAMRPEIDLDSLQIYDLNEHTTKQEMDSYVRFFSEGKIVGIIPDAGSPVIADPGKEIVMAAHRMKVRVVPVSGPSSVVLALEASGFSGQKFSFHGYLPKEKDKRFRYIKRMEDDSKHYGVTQVFIEAPYRNDQLLKDLLELCNKETLLCLAVDITLAGETIQTKTVEEWKKLSVSFHKRPAVFLLSSENSSR